ncbi:SHOCT domain-containing protein [Microbacterium sp. NPDC089320]|uniref:SHOCT domain-containing protein n=1 Tax=Microbacterium sp. NPDC089320 TaxID=3155182 RepID=UPI0014396262
MTFWDTLWSFFGFFFWSFVFIAYLMALFSVIGDIFRDQELNGWLKALWMIFLVFVPFLTLFVYLIARGRSMAERSGRAAVDAQRSTDAYIRNVAGSTSSADEIAKAKTLLDAGTITPDEFAALKARALQVT